MFQKPIFVLLLAFISIQMSGQNQQRTIEVNGTNSIKLKPDIYVGELTISSNDYEINPIDFEQKVDLIIQQLNVKNEMLNTLNKDFTDGFFSNVTLKVSANQKKQIETQLVSLRVNYPETSIDFSIIDRVVSENIINGREIEMFKLAVANAEEKAKKLAGALQLKPGKIIKIQDYSNLYPVSSLPSIDYSEAEDVNYEKSVTVTFELLE